MNNRQISYKYLPGETKYDFCPHCVKEMEEEGKDYKKELHPLKKVVMGEPIKKADGRIEELVTVHYECRRCNLTNITDNTFLIYYACRFDGTKFNEPPKSPRTIWSSTKNQFVLADLINNKWVEREA